MEKIVWVLEALLLCATFDSTLGHGRLLDPPSRSSMWRFPDDPAIKPYLDIVKKNYNDNELFCGGFQHQQNQGGKCGVCGDPYDGPRDNEAGGRFAQGIIVRKYSVGESITVKVELTAHHKGYFEFRLCPWDKPSTTVTQECLDRYLLQTPTGTKWVPQASTAGSYQSYQIKVDLPEGVKCSQCVFQWRYHTGNSWGCDKAGECGVGNGPQEEFYGCADISIGTSSQTPPIISNSPTTKTSTTMSTSPTTTTKTSHVNTPYTSITDDSCKRRVGNIIRDCHSFYTCIEGNDHPFIFACPPGTVFNEQTKFCDHAYNTPYPCGDKK